MAREVVIVLTAQDNYSQALKQMNQALGETGTAAQQSTSGFSQLGTAVTGFITAYAG